MPCRPIAGVAASFVVSMLLACSWKADDGDEHDDNNFRPDVIECEDALSRVERCCPGFDPEPVLCNFYYDKSNGCGTVTTQSVQPAFTRDESACIRDRSCDALVAEKVCERAQAARAYSSSVSTSSSSDSGPYGSSSTTRKTHAPVCP